jgi:N-methylhydantoinase B/oxoprolinase/acetone carboxylase alpha subunit
VLIRGDDETELSGKVTLHAEPGDIVSVRSPGGGGWGAPTPDPNATVPQ